MRPWHRTIRDRDGVRRSTPSDRLERWLGRDKVEYLSAQFRTWYGPPVHLIDVPGSVRVCAGGDFVGPVEHGASGSVWDWLRDRLRQAGRELSRPAYATLGAGFGSVSEALARATSGYGRLPGGMFQKVGGTGVVGSASSLWRVGNQPASGVTPAAAPAGLAPVDSTQGGLLFQNPSSGTLRLVGADASASIINNCLMLYDRIFHVAKTINSTANESVTGVPTRYQSSVATAEDYSGGNFLFMEVGATALAATAHNHGVAGGNECLYRNQAGTDNQALPVLAGISGAIADRFDMPLQTWFAPLAAGNIGIMDLVQMRTSAAVATGTLNFVIGHPIGVMAFPILGILLPFDWITNRNQGPRIFDDACLALFELPKPATTATTYNGLIYATAAAP